MPLNHLLRKTATLALLAATLPAAAADDLKPAPKATPAVADFNTCEKPVWPREALRREQQGAVTLSFLIAEDGAVGDSRVIKSSGYPLLDDAARDGIAKCRFKPSTLDGKPVAAWMKMQYRWTLEGGDAQGYERARKAAESGDVNGKLRLAGYMLTPGRYQAPEEGLALLRRMANGGNATAQEMLALALMQGRFVTPDMGEAAAWMTKSAESGRPSAEYTLFTMLSTGVGVPRDAVAADRWLRQAAEHGHAGAQTRLGVALTWQPAGAAEGIALLRKAAAQNDRTAQAALALCYETGRGVERDYGEAAALYRAAAGAGNAEAKRGLARLHEKGLGVEKDQAAAQRLFDEAARGGAAL